MATKKSELATRTETEALPDYLRHDRAPVGTESKGESTITPRLKVLQALSRDEELLEACGEGAMVLGDTGLAIADPSTPVIVVPLYQFPSWEIWADVNDASAESPVIDSTNDAKSEIARLAKQRHEETYPDNPKLKRSWVESLNVIVQIDGGALAEATGTIGEVALMSFARGNAKFGRQLKGYLTRTGADLFAHRIEFYIDKAKSNSGRWFAPRHRAAKPAWVSKDQYEANRLVYDRLHADWEATQPAS